jgi:non-homologous end joining protein Ku
MNQPIPANLKLVLDLETVLTQMVIDHRKLLAFIEVHQSAMKKMNLNAMDEARNQQEAVRLRIGGAEQRRRAIVQQIAKTMRVPGEPKIPQLAQMFPQRRDQLLKLRKDLQDVFAQIGAKNHVAGKVAGALLGHLNTAVRLLAGAVENAGVYTKRGVPQIASRIGMMDAVG